MQPVAGEVAIPVDAAREAGPCKGVDKHFLLFRGEDRRARIVPGVVVRDHLGECEVESWRGADAGDRLLRRRVRRPRRGLAHERIEGLLDAAAEYPVRLARGV